VHITTGEKKIAKAFATELLTYSAEQLNILTKEGTLIEVVHVR
jgi:hypothetical protein